ncbi:hypothetical protein QM012_006330 [Aureobasidium pullulans]|uniref:Uncharacterized protein n=1 Tax=Aureobasidium pullulans TaxID=5580 RepID=A0ABR0TSE0_AURPU
MTAYDARFVGLSVENFEHLFMQCWNPKDQTLNKAPEFQIKTTRSNQTNLLAVSEQQFMQTTTIRDLKQRQTIYLEASEVSGNVSKPYMSSKSQPSKKIDCR